MAPASGASATSLARFIYALRRPARRERRRPPDPLGINNSLAHIFRLLAGGHISTRRATGLAYISSLLLRTLPAIANGIGPREIEIFVPPREYFDPRPRQSTEPKETPGPKDDDPQGLASRNHAGQQPALHAAAREIPPYTSSCTCPLPQGSRIFSPQLSPPACLGRPAPHPLTNATNLETAL